MSKPHTPTPPYPAQFRQQIVQMMQAGRSASDLSRELCPHVTSILSWVRQAGEASGVVPFSDAIQD